MTTTADLQCSKRRSVAETPVTSTGPVPAGRSDVAHDLDSPLTGVSSILVTPYGQEGEIAPERLAPIVHGALAAGVHLPAVNGNTASSMR